MEKKEAMKILKDFYDKSALFSIRTALDTVIPELKESEGKDERIRKVLKEYFINSFQINGVAAICGVHIKDILAWLEKQGEQKPAWSKEDENLFRCAIDAVREESKVRTDGCLDEEVGEMVTNWLKSLKDRVLPQSRQEWSEDDENRINRLIAYFEDKESFTAEDDIIYANWLKSLKDRKLTPKGWKPSDEQITWLYRATDEAKKDSRMKQVLNELLSDLKKLME